MLECIKDGVMQEDVEKLAKDFPLIDKLRGKTVFITGATGLIGAQIIRGLACMNRQRGAQIHIVAFARNEKKASEMFGHLEKRGDVQIVIGDINAPLSLEQHIDYIIHGASATSSRYFVSSPVETIQTMLAGTANVLELARKIGTVEGVVYLSSLEVYGTPSGEHKTTTESDYGYIEPLNVRSSYSEGKRIYRVVTAIIDKIKADLEIEALKG